MLVSKRDDGADLSQWYVGDVSDAVEQTLRDCCVGVNKLDSSHFHSTAEQHTKMLLVTMRLNDKQWQVQTARGNHTFEKNNKMQFNVVLPLYPTSSV